MGLEKAEEGAARDESERPDANEDAPSVPSHPEETIVTSSPHPEEYEEEKKEIDEDEEDKIENPYRIGDNVDWKDEVKHWLNAEVIGIKGNKIFVHFTGWDTKYNEWIFWNSSRVLMQWRPGWKFKLNNRIDVKDTINKWCEARVIEVKPNSIVVHYKGFTSKFDEELANDSSRIAQIGRFSDAYGSGNKLKRLDSKQQEDEETDEATKHKIKLEEDMFGEKLAEKNWRIKHVGGDGNCLFRAVSHQIYGTEDHHKYIRDKCMDYISLNKNFFKQFIIGGDQTIDQYIEEKRRVGVWGDDIEIHALSEMYDMPIQIYAYSNTPMRTFSESRKSSGKVIMLSYHRRSHYNSIVDLDVEPSKRIISDSLGTLEELAIAKCSYINNSNRIMSALEGGDDEEAKEGSNIENLFNANADLIAQYRDIIQRSRTEFESQGIRDMELALEESLRAFQNERGRDDVNEEEIAIQASKQLYEQNLTEEDLLKIAMEESLKANEEGLMDPALAMSLESGMLENAMNFSQREFNLNQLRNTSTFQNLRAMGFDEDKVIDAMMTVGNEENYVLSYLLG